MATELAKAYVQIVPSAKGIKSGIEQALGGDGSSAGQSFGANLLNRLKGLIAAAGIGKALAAAVNEGAALEQSIGGIETLFGAGGRSVEEYAESIGKSVTEAQGQYDILMQSQQAVLDNAQRAYATSGMSANEYMEMATGFSASLLNSLGGDTLKAAEIADMAMIDMSDNANKMGTNMEDIKNAYQGFAKQNYTINLMSAA